MNDPVHFSSIITYYHVLLPAGTSIRCLNEGRQAVLSLRNGCGPVDLCQVSGPRGSHARHGSGGHCLACQWSPNFQLGLRLRKPASCRRIREIRRRDSATIWRILHSCQKTMLHGHTRHVTHAPVSWLPSSTQANLMHQRGLHALALAVSVEPKSSSARRTSGFLMFLLLPPLLLRRPPN